MVALNWVTISSIIVDLLIISELIFYTYWGQRKGLVDALFKLIIFAASLLIAFMFYKPVSNFVIEKTQIDEWLNIRIEETLIGHEIVDGKMVVREDVNLSKGVVNFINSIIQEGINQAKDNLSKYIAEKLSYFMISTLTLISLLIIVRVCLGFVKAIANIIAKLPIINLFNQAGGAILGLLKGLVIIYVILAILSIISPLINDLKILEFINDSKLGALMYNNNLLVNLITKK